MVNKKKTLLSEIDFNVKMYASYLFGKTFFTLNKFLKTLILIVKHTNFINYNFYILCNFCFLEKSKTGKVGIL